MNRRQAKKSAEIDAEKRKFSRCPVCQSGFQVQLGGFKPGFKCSGCGNFWQYGCDGGEYLQYATNYKGQGVEAFVSFVLDGGKTRRTNAPLAEGWNEL